MRRIHEQCVEYGTVNGRVNYIKGANIAGFKKVADATLAFGIVQPVGRVIPALSTPSQKTVAMCGDFF